MGPFFAWSIATNRRPSEWQLDRIESADFWVRTEKVVMAPPSVPENEPVPLLGAPLLPGILNITRPFPDTEPPTLLTVVTVLPEDSWGVVFYLVVSVPLPS